MLLTWELIGFADDSCSCKNVQVEQNNPYASGIIHEVEEREHLLGIFFQQHHSIQLGVRSGNGTTGRLRPCLVNSVTHGLNVIEKN